MAESITLTTKWVRGLLKSLDCVKRHYTTAKKEMNPALYELTFSWRWKITNTIFQNKIQKEIILNFDQTALGFTAPNKSMFTGKGVHSVPIANVDNKHQIAATFCINIVGDFFLYLGFTPCKAEQLLQGMKLQQKQTQKD